MSAAAAADSPSRAARSLAAVPALFVRSTRSSCPRARRPGASSLGEGRPEGGPPDPPSEVGAALNGRPEGGRRAPRPAVGPSEIRRPRAWPLLAGGSVLPLLFLRALAGADRPRPPRAPCSARAGGAGFRRAGAPPPEARGP